MKHYVVEHWSYRPAWHDLSQEQRALFLDGIRQAVKQMASAGIRTLGFGRLDHSVDHANRAYDFWSLWEIDSIEARDLFFAGVAASGWYNYFEHANTAGVLESPEAVLKEHLGV